MSVAIFDGTGADPTDWSAADNWTGGSGAGGVPAAGDDVRVGRIPAAVTANPAAFSAITIVTATVTSECRQALGGAATGITFTTCTTLNYAGQGEYCRWSTPVSGNAYVNLTGGTFIHVTGTIVSLTGAGTGFMQIGTSGVVTNAYNNGLRWTDESGTAYTVFDQGSGNSTVRRNIGTGLINSGPLELAGTAAVTTSLTVFAQGRVYGKASGTITLLEVKPSGVFSLLGNLNAALTITDRTIWAGATYQNQAAGLTLTETNATKYRGVVAQVPAPIAA